MDRQGERHREGPSWFGKAGWSLVLLFYRAIQGEKTAKPVIASIRRSTEHAVLSAARWFDLLAA